MHSTLLTTDPDDPTRIVLVPSFVKTGTLALVCLETLECKTIEFEVPAWAGDLNGQASGEADDVKME